MSWNGSGTFIRKFSWVAQAAAGVNISSVNMDTDTNDIVTSGLGNALTRDGQGGPTANLPMNNFHHTGASPGVLLSDYATLGQIQSGQSGQSGGQTGSFNWAIAGGQSDAITATLAPALTSLADGQLLFLRASSANSTPSPTLLVNGLPTTPAAGYPITREGGLPLVPGDIPGALSEIILRFNLANTRWELLNPATNQSIIPSGTETFYAGISAPQGWYFEDGRAISRTGDPGLFAALTLATTAVTTAGNVALTSLPFDTSATGILGAVVEGVGIATGTTVIAIAPTTVTMSSPASSSSGTAIAIRFLPYGQGDGSSSFNIPDRRGRTIFGRDDMDSATPAGRITGITAQGINGRGLGNTGGEQAHSMLQGEIIGHQHSVFLRDPGHLHSIGQVINNAGTGGSGGVLAAGGTATNTSTATTGLTVGSVSGVASDNLTTSEGIGTGFDGVGRAFNVIPPSSVSNVIIKR